MIRGINQITAHWKLKILSSTIIQKTWRMHLNRKQYKKTLNAIKYIANYWKYTWKARKFFLNIKKIVKILQPIIRYLII